MKFVCDKNNLLGALSVATRALANKANTPILTGIYLKAQDNKIEMQTNNNEIGISTFIDAQVEEPGEMVLPGKYLQDMSRNLPGPDVNFAYSAANGTVSIVSQKTKFSLKSMNISEFPLINRSEPEGGLSFTMPSDSLLKLIRKTSFSCAAGETGEARPIFTGCYVVIADNTFTMVATNTHRLAYEKLSLPGDLPNATMIIPAKILSELNYIIDSDVPVDVQIKCDQTKISFACEDTFMISRLIEGQFPEYQKVIPPSVETTAIINTKEFFDAVNRISLISRSNNYNIIKLEFSEGQVHMSSTNPDIGNADEIVPLQLTGPDLNISFNVTYLTDVLKIIEGETCHLGMNAPLKPITVKDVDDADFLYVLTPVRTSD
jgi:DNA polymerase-3 subunit beta